MDHYDFKRALVKESIPVCLLALANYSRQYFKSEQDMKQIFKEIFGMLFKLAEGNNCCKGQIFKGDGLYHFDQLLKSENKYAFFFLD